MSQQRQILRGPSPAPLPQAGEGNPLKTYPKGWGGGEFLLSHGRAWVSLLMGGTSVGLPRAGEGNPLKTYPKGWGGGEFLLTHGRAWVSLLMGGTSVGLPRAGEGNPLKTYPKGWGGGEFLLTHGRAWVSLLMGGTSVGLPRVGVGVGNSLKTFARGGGGGGFLCALGRALVLLFIGISSFAANESHVRVSLLAEVSAVSPGEPFWVAVRLEHDPGWHTYYKEPGDSGLPTKIGWVLPEGFSAGPIRWPVPQRIELPPLVNYGYEGEAALLVLITPPAQIAGETVPLSAQVRWLECQEACVPGQADVSLSLPVSESPVEPSIEMALFFGEARALLEKEPKPLAGAAAPLGALILGWRSYWPFWGGMLLNLMPCVLPVLSIKFLGFLDTPRETLRQHGLLYGVGVLVSFWALAGVLIFLRAGGKSWGGGFNFNHRSLWGFWRCSFLLWRSTSWAFLRSGPPWWGWVGWWGENPPLTRF
jgi:hypothetical protein